VSLWLSNIAQIAKKKLLYGLWMKKLAQILSGTVPRVSITQKKMNHWKARAVNVIQKT
jgi:hypothetical protein